VSELKDWNASIINEFRANEGRVGGQFEPRSTAEVFAGV
jgi:hypothetical protein